MIMMTVQMTDEVYEHLRSGVGIGIFSFSLDDLKKYGVEICDIRHYEGS